jgi:hypothetical protein
MSEWPTIQTERELRPDALLKFEKFQKKNSETETVDRPDARAKNFEFE